MAWWSGAKQMFGGAARGTATIASAATIVVPEEGSIFYVSGTTAVTSLLCSKQMRGRSVTFVGTSNVGNVFTNTDSATVEGTMDLGGNDVTLGPASILQLYCKPENGAWVMLDFQFNN